MYEVIKNRGSKNKIIVIPDQNLNPMDIKVGDIVSAVEDKTEYIGEVVYVNDKNNGWATIEVREAKYIDKAYVTKHFKMAKNKRYKQSFFLNNIKRISNDNACLCS